MHVPARSARLLTAAVAASLLVAATAGSAAAWSAADGVEIVTGFGPRAVALADLDADGTADIVTANGVDASVSVVMDPLGAGLSVTYPVDGTPVSLAIGDVGSDGTLDIVLGVSGPDSLLVFPVSPGGTLGSPTSLALAATPNAVGLLDLDRDGTTDIIAATADGRLRVVSMVDGGLAPGTSLGVGGVPVDIEAFTTSGPSGAQLVVLDGQSGGVTTVKIARGRLRVAGRASLGAVAADLAVVGRGDSTRFLVTLPDRNEVALLGLRPSGRPAEIERLALRGTPFGVTPVGDEVDPPRVLVSLRTTASVAELELAGGHLAVVDVEPVGVCPSAVAVGQLGAGASSDLVVAEPCTNDVIALPGA